MNIVIDTKEAQVLSSYFTKANALLEDYRLSLGTIVDQLTESEEPTEELEAMLHIVAEARLRMNDGISFLNERIQSSVLVAERQQTAAKIKASKESQKECPGEEECKDPECADGCKEDAAVE